MKKGLIKKSKKGFTLIELVVVIAILGILAAILIPVIGGFIRRANVAKDQANARNLYNCVAMALATDAAVGTGANKLNLGQGVLDLFGSVPTADTASFTIDSTTGTVDTATYNGQTYNGDGTFSGS